MQSDVVIADVTAGMEWW